MTLTLFLALGLQHCAVKCSVHCVAQCTVWPTTLCGPVTFDHGLSKYWANQTSSTLYTLDIRIYRQFQLSAYVRNVNMPRGGGGLENIKM